MFLLLILGACLAWKLQKLIYRRCWNQGLSLTVTFRDPSVYEGETSALTEVLINNKNLPLPVLEVWLAMSRDLEFAGEARDNSQVSDQSYKRDIFSCLAKQRISRTLPFAAKRRGYYQVTGSNLVGNDLLMTENYYQEVPQQTQMYVYPAQVDASRIRLICKAISGMVLSRNRLYPDPFEFSGIREYRREDPMNQINWKASARTGELMVNQFDATTSISVTILLDIEDPGMEKQQELVEEGIRIASSLSARMVRQKMGFSIKSNAIDEDTGAPLQMRMPAGAGQVARLNQKLARVDIRREVTPGCEFYEEASREEETGHTYVVISKVQSPENTAALRRLAETGSQVLLVAVTGRDYADAAFYGNGITVITWEAGR